MTSEERLIHIITADPERVAVLSAVAKLGLPDAWVAGGYIRNPAWDALFENVQPTPANDVDVIYFKPLAEYGVPEPELIESIRLDRDNPVWREEAAARAALEKACPHLEYEVKNQARMYLSVARTVPHDRYRSLADAVSGWPETATATGMRLNDDGTYSVLAPYGLDDLFAGLIRPTGGASIERVHERVSSKKWLTHWPELKFVMA